MLVTNSIELIPLKRLAENRQVSIKEVEKFSQKLSLKLF